MCRSRRSPKKFVNFARTAVAEQRTVLTELQSAVHRKTSQEFSIRFACVGQSVFVTDLSKMVVARISVSTLAVVQLIPYGVVIVALEASNVVLSQYWKHTIWIGTECAHIAETKILINLAAFNIAKGTFQREIVAIDASEAGNSVERRQVILPPRVASKFREAQAIEAVWFPESVPWHWNKWPRIGNK